tara:strand:- start:100 stop:906 length:807 start_codon:yes stop_codon:yes gene_type:complete
MIIFKSINRLNNEVNFKADVGFVPTMGALHQGHVSLIKKSQNMCNKTLVSIFVNPTQFNEKKDYKNYPKSIKKDIKLLNRLKVDYVLIPSVKDIYKNKNKNKFKISNSKKVLCAKYRPGHFEGVLSVINQYIKKIKVKKLFLGEKDYQQYLIIKEFLKKKKSKINIILCRTKRMKNGLAFSSRNKLLNYNSIKKSALIVSKIKKMFNLLKNDLKNKVIIKKFINNNKNLYIEYLELRNKNNLSKYITKKNVKIFFSFYVQGVRLIDNY